VSAIAEPEVEAPLWREVERLVALAAHDADVLEHRLAPFAARLRRERGLAVSEQLAAVERRAALTALTGPMVLRRVRAAVEGDLVVVKGPEVAARYPDRALRGFGDLDVLARDAAGVHAALLAAGAVEVGDPALFVDIHHLRPVGWPDLPLVVEVHSRPKWVDSLPPLSFDRVLVEAVPADVDAEGFLAPRPEAHAVLLAVHSWAHEPLRRLRDMVDVAVMLAESDWDGAHALAEAWGVARLWQTTEAAVDALFHDGTTPVPMRLWGQNLARARGRTVLEAHLERWCSDFSIMPPSRALVLLPGVLVDEVRPETGETWGDKLRRVALALRNGLRRRFEHDDELKRR
jgi:hypothetical protein